MDRSHRPHDAVAAYASLEGAERAAAHLVSQGYDEHDVKIGPCDYEVVDAHLFRGRLRTWVPRGVGAGALAALGIALGIEVGLDALVGSMLPRVIAGAAIGLILGLAVAAVAYRVRLARTFLSTPDVLEPTRFEVIADRDRDRACNDLARWWDPEAPSAGWREAV